MQVTKEKRETWSSRPAFLLAAIGAAVGFGNVWRFPALAYDYGGGAFFLPYFLALIFVGIPLLLLEISMGQHLQTGDVGVTGYLNKHFRGVGLASVVCGFMVVTYYVPLISWCFRAFFESFGKMSNEWENIGHDDAVEYFFHDVLGTFTLDEDKKPTRIIFLNVVYLAFTWVIVGACISFGIRWTGRIAYFTAGLPVVMLAILLIRSVTLDGAKNGIHEYIGSWKWSVLVKEPDVWSTAVTQVFFSIGVAFGIMTAFGSRCEKNAPAFQNSLVIAITDSVFSVISGLCVFAILGYLAEIEGDFVVHAGPALLFGAYPAALATIPGGIHWVRFLFFNLILLGLDSAFAIVEAAVTVIEDSTFNKFQTKTNVAILCTAGFLLGLIYTTDAAITFLDVVDFYVNFVILLLGFCKTFAAGWLYGIQKQIEELGYVMVYCYIVSTFGSILLASLVWFGVAGNTVWIGFLCLFVQYGAGMWYCRKKMKERVSVIEGRTMESMTETLLMGNILSLKEELEASVGYIPYAWAVVIKHVIPQVLLILFFNLAFARSEHGQFELGNYGDYRDWPFQILGLCCVALALVIVGLGLGQARLFDGFIAKQDDELSIEMIEKDDYIEMCDNDNDKHEEDQTEEDVTKPVIVLS